MNFYNNFVDSIAKEVLTEVRDTGRHINDVAYCVTKRNMPMSVDAITTLCVEADLMQSAVTEDYDEWSLIDVMKHKLFDLTLRDVLEETVTDEYENEINHSP